MYISSSKNRVIRFSTGVLNLISRKYKCENQFGLLFYGTVVYVSKRSRCISFLQWPNFIVRGHEIISKFFKSVRLSFYGAVLNFYQSVYVCCQSWRFSQIFRVKWSFTLRPKLFRILPKCLVVYHFFEWRTFVISHENVCKFLKNLFRIALTAHS